MTDIPGVQKYTFMALMMPSIGANVVCAATIEAFPTRFRAMAMCIALMFGRLGAVSGSYIVAILLKNYCESTFYLSGSSILGKVVQFSEFSILLFNDFLNSMQPVGS